MFSPNVFPKFDGGRYARAINNHQKFYSVNVRKSAILSKTECFDRYVDEVRELASTLCTARGNSTAILECITDAEKNDYQCHHG